MGLLRRYLQSEIAELHKNGVRLRIIGERHGFSADIVTLIENAERSTAANTGLNLTIALNYGGRREIVLAARALAKDVAEGKISPDAIDECTFASRLSTADVPDPDLLIRTSGEQRISNFLLWQSAYTELVFLDILWPDFTERHLADAVREFSRRERRYGASSG
jgi:undecaprenyl diphosphate synthase